MERTRAVDLVNKTGERVRVAGFVDVRRDHGKLIFLDVRDRTGSVQVVVTQKAADAFETVSGVRPQSAIEIEGEVRVRPETQKGEGPLGGIELSASAVRILSLAHELPFDLDADLNLDTLLDYRPLTLRREKERAIFKVQAEITRAYRTFLNGEGFTEFQPPKLVGGDAEGGAEVFKVGYFNDKTAYLATSPQLYKQIMVGVFERVFSVGTMFRAERSATTRHLSEIAMLDLEMGFIEDHRDVMALVTRLMRSISSHVTEYCAHELRLFEADAPKAPETFPTFTLREAQELIKKETGTDKTGAPDLDPEDERFLCEYAAEHLDSDFVFVTHFPTNKRPFYTHVEPEDPTFSRSFDLLFRGLEMCSGAQRVHEYDELIRRIEEKGLDPEKFSFYLQAFKYGLPPHGGIGMGLERLTMKMLGVPNVKEATLFPRDMTRIDTRLSE